MALADAADSGMSGDRKVHSIRKRCKKVRGLLRLVRPLMCDAFDDEDRRLRNAFRELATVREMSARAGVLASLGDDEPECHPSAATAAALAAATQLLAASLEDIDDWPLDLHGFVDLGPGFAQTYRKLLKVWQQVLLEPSDANYHELRKWTKYHWYHVRILERINKKKLRPRRNALRKMQLELGEAHDFSLLVDQPGNDETDDELLRHAQGRAERLYEKALERGREVFAVSVNVLVADHSRWWLTWDREG